MSYSTSWFHISRLTCDPIARVFCFPYAGAGASIFQGWADKLPCEIDLLALQAPGRETRFAEPAHTSLPDLVSEISAAIGPFLNVPSMFVGHSNGALIAFELLRSLAQEQRSRVHTIVLAAKRAPHLVRLKPKIHDLPPDQFRDKLRAMGSVPESVLLESELMELYDPLLRADFALSETYQFVESEPLTAQPVLLWGEHDVDVSKADTLAWQEHFDRTTQMYCLDGEHLFIRSHEERYVDIVRKHALANPTLEER